MRALSKNNHKVASPRAEEGNQIDNLSKIMQEVLERTKDIGATSAMVSINNDRGFAVDVRMQKVESVAFSEDKSINLVLYIGHQKGSASSTDTSSNALKSLVAAAYDIAKVSASDPCFGLPAPELMSNHYPELSLYHHFAITPKHAIKTILSCEAYALALDKRISNSDGVNLSTYSFCNGFANSYGNQSFVQSTRHSISCSLIAEVQDGMQRDYDYTTSRNPANLTSIEALAARVVERTVSRLGARQIKTQKAPVLFSSRVSSSLLSSFINAISGVNLYRKNSFLLDALDTQIFPANFKIYEQPHLLAGLGSSPFDGEGVLTRNNIFVEDGFLRNYALSSYSARKLGLSTTANSGGVHNLTLDPTCGGLNDLLTTMHTGLLVTELMGHGINGLTGDFSRGASGFWVENGCIQYPVQEVSIAGNLRNMFKSIKAVGNDIDLNLATRCGSILIDSMMIAGH